MTTVAFILALAFSAALMAWAFAGRGKTAICGWCDDRLPARARASATFCSTECEQAHMRCW
jgi:hypothetical protein